MTKKPYTVDCDVCVIGAGAGGLSVAAACSQLGLNTTLVEKSEMGGECLNAGCIPSKALIAAANRAHKVRKSDVFGLRPIEPVISFEGVINHVKQTIAAIAPTDSVSRFEALGVYVVKGEAAFTDRDTIQVNRQLISAKRFILALGAQAFIPLIDGLSDTPYLTHETLTGLEDLPKHLVIIGGGATGTEMAQSFRRLGSHVSLIEGKTLLHKEDPETVDIIRQRLVMEGVNLVEEAAILSVATQKNGLHRITYEHDGKSAHLDGSHILIACGKIRDFSTLNLDKAQVEWSDQGIVVNPRLQTSNKAIYALGDCVENTFGTTHGANYQAGIVIKNLLFRLPVRQKPHFMPRVTFTDPELAHVGMTEAEARLKHGDDIAFARWSLNENDRAQTERAKHGMVKAVMRKNGAILGATIVAPNAGEMIQPWVMALQHNMKINAIADMVYPYPAMGEISKRAAGSFFLRKFLSPLTKKIVRFLFRLG